ncbi:MAG: permease-like cell division protein FtsX, partial [Bacteroidota bacterium]
MCALIKSRWKAAVRITLTAISVTLLVTFGYFSFRIINEKISTLKHNLVLSVVFEKSATEDTIKTSLTQIKTQPWTKDFNYISPSQSLDDFVKKYGKVSENLLPVNPFPAIVNMRIADSYCNQKSFEIILSVLKQTEFVDKINYREDFTSSVFVLAEQTKILMISVYSILGLMLLLLIFLSVRPEYIESAEDFRQHNFFGSENKFSKLHIFIFISI